MSIGTGVWVFRTYLFGPGKCTGRALVPPLSNALFLFFSVSVTVFLVSSVAPPRLRSGKSRRSVKMSARFNSDSRYPKCFPAWRTVPTICNGIWGINAAASPRHPAQTRNCGIEPETPPPAWLILETGRRSENSLVTIQNDPWILT